MTQLGVAGSSASSVRLTARVRVEVPATLDADLVPTVLGSSEAPWLGEAVSSPDRTFRSYLCDLELRAGGTRRVRFRKAVVVSLGEPRQAAGSWVVPIEWRAATLTALFPVLVGHLRVEPARITLDGRYAPPGGALGYLIDVALLHAAARQTGHWFLRKVAAELTYVE